MKESFLLENIIPGEKLKNFVTCHLKMNDTCELKLLWFRLFHKIKGSVQIRLKMLLAKPLKP